jgi:hypothetical protein
VQYVGSKGRWYESSRSFVPSSSLLSVRHPSVLTVYMRLAGHGSLRFTQGECSHVSAAIILK